MAAGAVDVAGHVYDAYLPAATKKHQYYHFTCEFDAAWVVLKTYGFDASLDDQLKAFDLWSDWQSGKRGRTRQE